MARASALHAEGHRFDSDILHQQKLKAESIKLKQKQKPVLKILDAGIMAYRFVT